jgi:hypothetical protein
MPSYISNPQVSQVKAIYPGSQYAVVPDASKETVTKSIQFAVGPLPNAGMKNLNVVNTTNQTATCQMAMSDGDANYAPIASIAPATNTSVSVSVGVPCWIRFTFSPAPTSGSLIVG